MLQTRVLYVVTCDEPHCAYPRGQTTHYKEAERAVAEAEADGWRERDGRWTCRRCLDDRRTRQQQMDRLRAELAGLAAGGAA